MSAELKLLPAQAYVYVIGVADGPLSAPARTIAGQELEHLPGFPQPSP